ncbi:hypothetical protein EDD18DRAFT_1183523 [Armillaria luteobubalina]|uniref:Uncharacterized protein n=1 Tax=Armillaria luteobubalina TaxID=153913 RepID=A0AA39PX77_9AGAR|nr:hypothetical protein EDD18DRAFT_1183523 [Armillaria luteobubalina]
MNLEMQCPRHRILPQDQQDLLFCLLLGLYVLKVEVVTENMGFCVCPRCGAGMFSPVLVIFLLLSIKTVYTRCHDIKSTLNI